MRSATSFLPLAGLFLALSALTTSCSRTPKMSAEALDPADTAEGRIGERLFRDTRFSQLFFAKSGGNANAQVDQTDHSLVQLQSHRGTLPGPFAGQSMSCVACHMVDQAVTTQGAGMRTYDDFSDRTAIPARADGARLTTRNSPPLVGSTESREGPAFFHYDGEFVALEDLVIGGFTGRNFGWEPNEGGLALANLARVVREDNGGSALARLFGGVSYAQLFLGEDALIREGYVLSERYRMDVSKATDEQIAQRVGELVKIYMESLSFAKKGGLNSGSAYDAFLEKNELPRSPEDGETQLQYAGRLAWAIQRLTNPKFVGGEDGELTTHNHSFEFGATELSGLKIFLARSRLSTAESPGALAVGNCVACHTPPSFSDFRFHNTGATQEEYDALHGSGAFIKLNIPSQLDRIANVDDTLPATGAHPNALGRFRSPTDPSKPGFTDLGVWNVIFNPDFPKPQEALRQVFCGDAACDVEKTLADALGRFKTPSVRDLGHSDPYLHTGRMKTVEELVEFYRQMGRQARAGTLRNGAPELEAIELSDKDALALAAFLRALDEDYE